MTKLLRLQLAIPPRRPNQSPKDAAEASFGFAGISWTPNRPHSFAESLKPVVLPQPAYVYGSLGQVRPIFPDTDCGKQRLFTLHWVVLDER